MILKFVIRIFFALLAGLSLTLWLAGRDARIHHAIEQRIMPHFAKSLDCKLEGRVTHINFFSPALVVDAAGASSHNSDDWHWRSKQCTFTFSYLEFIKTGKIAVNVHIDGADVSSRYDKGVLPITDHLKKLVSFQQDIPLALKQLLVTNGTFTIHDLADHSEIRFDFKSEASTVLSQFKSTMYVTGGHVIIKERDIARAFEGTLAAEISRDPEHPYVGGLIDLSLKVPQLPTDEQHCSLEAHWKDKQGTVKLTNKQETYGITRADIRLTDSGSVHADVHAFFPLSYIETLYKADSTEAHVRGVCTMETSITNAGTSDQHLNAHVSIADCGWHRTLLEGISAQITQTKGVWNAALQFQDPLFGVVEGTASWHEQKQRGNVRLENGGPLTYAPFKYWYVLPHEIHIDAQFNQKGSLEGEIKATAHHEKLGTEAVVVGTLAVDPTHFLLTGSVNDKPYVVDVALKPRVLLNNILITDQKGEQLIAIKGGSLEHMLFEGVVTFPFLRTILLSSTGYDMKGTGDVTVKAALKDTKLYGQLVLPDGNIRLGSTYNYIQEAVIPLEVDIAKRTCVFMGAHVKLHKGSIRCQRATVAYNDEGKITFAHMPLLFNKLFLNQGKDMFAVISGYGVLTHSQDELPFIQGTLSVERAQVKQNILSGNVQGSLLKDVSSALLLGSAQDVAFDIRLLNRHPLQVRTNVLHTDLDLYLKCTGSLSAPRVEGSVNLTHGTLHFPYKPLSIVNGMLHFEPHQPDDPRIELTAKGNIKRYTVTMQVGGTVRNPTFNFSSSPSLDEEQIITLLLAGSEAGSLSLVMPSLILQNLQNYIFGSDHGSSTVETYVNNVLAPFKHIRIVPSFSDQTARGGFRGAIEIDVSDRLHATIQKNFSLTEDTRVELEFRASDEINIRGIKDERGDLGGEVETRFSF